MTPMPFEAPCTQMMGHTHTHTTQHNTHTLESVEYRMRRHRGRKTAESYYYLLDFLWKKARGASRHSV